MYQLDRTNNDIVKLERKQFGDLAIREREHLQEWIAKNPEVLGEELLIIQKEFAGFNDTRERLDLLAIDKQGRVVVIENKLDDTGRDVMWQALKYTSYCSTLTTVQILQIFQDYLDSSGSSDSAKEVLMDFLEFDDENELLLNDGDQRVILVANNFRKEVTSTVLWLIDHDIQISCFRATPYSNGQNVFLQIDQIIPLPETQEFMIDMKEKEREEKKMSKSTTERKDLLLEFWGLVNKSFEEKSFSRYDRIVAKPYYDHGFHVKGGYFACVIGRHGIRVELYFSSDKDKSKIDSMLNHKQELEEAFGDLLIFERLESKTASRVKFEMLYKELYKKRVRFTDKSGWPARIDWFSDTMPRFCKAVIPVWERLNL